MRPALPALLLLLGLQGVNADALAEEAPGAPVARYVMESQVSGELSSLGDPTMAGLMEAWLQGFQARQPGILRGRWQHDDEATAIGALMFELADIAPIGREFTPAELAPYRHQFAGDMMKAPLLIQVGSRAATPWYLAVNRRPGAPLPQKTKEFLSYVLSRDGQEVLARSSGFAPLSPADAAGQRARLDGYRAELDPDLHGYTPVPGLAGGIRSVGSDGLKSLMDRWMRDFSRVSPGVGPGLRWEHVGTLNGFHALLLGEADIAPMGRELWPDERSDYEAVHGKGAAPLEIRVARGGFNTPQRTTAQAIFVHQDNPLSRITIGQLAQVFGSPRTLTHWGELGLTGEWADRPIRVYAPPLIAPNATSMRLRVLGGSDWSDDIRQGTIEETAGAIARDPAAIGFGGFEDGGPGIKPLAVADRGGGPFVEGSGASVSSGRYPLSRYMYIRLNQPPGVAIPTHVREFLRFILSRDGQEPILYSGYFPLTAAEVEEELSRLDSSSLRSSAAASLAESGR